MKSVDQAKAEMISLCIPEPNSGCWLWLGSAHSRGPNSYVYGRYSWNGEQMAHRVSQLLWNGPIPEGQIVRHKCDNPLCVNPEHLEPGTLRDNVHDCIKRHRHVAPVGERHGKSKRTPEQVRAMRDAMAAGLPKKQIAARFGVPFKSLHRVIQCWQHLDTPQERKARVETGRLYGYCAHHTPQKKVPRETLPTEGDS